VSVHGARIDAQRLVKLGRRGAHVALAEPGNTQCGSDFRFIEGRLQRRSQVLDGCVDLTAFKRGSALAIPKSSLIAIDR
jgi:hypothetical protein